ncbi:MAG: hypothetical protein MUC98_14420, partial [Desulfobacterota bacterium]|nr:hypothetical protein [Thermodesulfobacteriota bacterium]
NHWVKPSSWLIANLCHKLKSVNNKRGCCPKEKKNMKTFKKAAEEQKATNTSNLKIQVGKRSCRRQDGVKGEH